MQLVFWIAVAYLLGQIVAEPSAALLEHGVVRGFLHPPLSVALGLRDPRWRETIMRRLFANREYGPLPVPTRAKIFRQAAETLNTPLAEMTDAEAIFGLAFDAARKNADTAARLDQFRNLYGFSRNVSFVSLVAAVLMAIRYYKLPEDLSRSLLLGGAMVLAIGMFGRFLKFYAAFSTELLRAYANQPKVRKENP